MYSHLTCLRAKPFKWTSSAVMLAVLSIAGPVMADTSTYYVRAPVLDVEPVVSRRTIEQPVEQCRVETVTTQVRSSRRDHRHEPAIVPGIIGGLIGGIIGNQFGGGSGKKALTVVGALAGSSIARNASRQRDHYDHYQPRTTKRCTTTYETQVIEEVSGYDVTYEYGGREFVKRVDEMPGDTVRVRVELAVL